MSDPLHQLLNRLLRRAHLIRLAESLGLSFAAVSIITALLLPIPIYRQSDLTPLLYSAAALAVVTGFLLAMLRRRTTLDLLIDIDRQLKLHDLLSSAYLSQKSADPFAQTVVQLAHARAQQIDPNQILFARLGSRAWSGIGLSLLLVATLSLIPLAMPDRAVAQKRSEMPSAESRSRENPQTLRNDSRLAPSSAENNSLDERSRPVPQAQSVESSDRSGSSSSGAAGGTSQGRSNTRKTPLTLQPGDASAISPGEQVAPGLGRSGVTGAAAESTDTTAAHAASVAAPPWNSQSWPAARESALQSIQRDAIPPEYRPFIRDYFDRR